MSHFTTESINGKWLCYPHENDDGRYSILLMSPEEKLYVLKAPFIRIDTLILQMALWLKIDIDDITYAGEERIKKWSRIRVLKFIVNTDKCPF